MNTVKTKNELSQKVSDDVDDTFHLEKDGESKELAWLPESLAKKLKRLSDKGEQEKMILDYISQSERDLEYSIESLEDDVVRYKGAMLKARRAFEEAKNEQLEANYTMWESFDKELPSVETKVEKLTAKIDPLVQKTIELNELLDKLSTYRIDNFLETLQKVERLMNDRELMDIVEKLNKHSTT